MSHNWFVEKNGKQHGPFTGRQLKQLAASGRLQKTDLVRREDQTASISAYKISSLFNGDDPTTKSATSATAAAAENRVPQSELRTKASTLSKTDSIEQAIWAEHPAIILASFLFPPAALFLIWRHRSWSTAKKVTWSSACSMLVLIGIGSKQGESAPQSEAEATTPISKPPSMLAVAEDQPAPATAPKNSTSPTSISKSVRHSQVNRSPDEVEVSHRDFTQVKMPQLPEDRIQRTVNVDAVKFSDQSPYKVDDISKIDFLHGVSGEPICLQILRWKDSNTVRETTYYYQTQSGKNVLHGPIETMKTDGERQHLSIYVHGTLKCSSSWSDGRALQLDRYEGDARHSRYKATYYATETGDIESERRYKVVHNITATEDAVTLVQDGFHQLYFDTRQVKRLAAQGVADAVRNQNEIRLIELWDSGRLQSREVFDREGNLVSTVGTPKN